MSSSLVTVIIPAYNAERYLRDAIQSVLNQTYGPIECLVIDDGSTDRTPEITSSFHAVRLIRKENGGVASARNAGVREANGDLIAFLDADDVWLPDKTVRQMEVLGSNPAIGMVYSGLSVVDDDLSPMAELRAPPPADALRNSLLMDPPVMSVAQTGLFRRSVLDEAGGFDERMSTSADTDLACRVASKHTIERVDAPLVLYRQHPDQMHHDVNATERDMLLLFSKIFGSGSDPSVKRLERRAYANLFATLGAARWSAGDRRSAASYLARSVAKDPRGVLTGVGRRALRLGRGGHSVGT